MPDLLPGVDSIDSSLTDIGVNNVVIGQCGSGADLTPHYVIRLLFNAILLKIDEAVAKSGEYWGMAT